MSGYLNLESPTYRDGDLAIKRLINLKRILENQVARIKRRRSWRPSEKAMAMADVVCDIESVALAITTLQAWASDRRFADDKNRRRAS